MSKKEAWIQVAAGQYCAIATESHSALEKIVTATLN